MPWSGWSGNSPDIHVLLARLYRIYEKNRNEAAGIILRRYPSFVLSDVEPAEIPVFQFHDVTREMLEPLLDYLQRNEYQTLTADEYHDRAIGAARRDRREVLLTFDDGELSLYSVAYPLLASKGQKAVAYVVANRVPEQEIGATRVSPLCNWQQLSQMHESGIIDVQSHSLYHHSVAVSGRVVDFVRPGISTSFLASDLSPLDPAIGGDAGLGVTAPGYPIHPWGGRMGDSPAFREAPESLSACVRHVADRGGIAFFTARSWRRELFRVLEEARRRHPPIGFESADEQREAMLADLRSSREVIESRLRKKTVRHYCFPWYRGSAQAIRLSGEAGYVSNAWASLLPRFANESSRSITAIPRLAPRYIWRLPGTGRKPLTSVLRA